MRPSGARAIEVQFERPLLISSVPAKPAGYVCAEAPAVRTAATNAMMRPRTFVSPLRQGTNAAPTPSASLEVVIIGSRRLSRHLDHHGQPAAYLVRKHVKSAKL